MSPSEQPILRAVGRPAGELTVPFEPCEQCGAPLAERQRYCVECGRRRTNADDPALRTLGAATRHRRVQDTAGAQPASLPRRSVPLALAASIAAVPLILGAGVLIGRSSAGGDASLIAALRAQKAPIIEYSGAPTAAQSAALSATSNDPTTPVSTFPLARGYTIELATLRAGTSAAAAARAQRELAAKGASQLGVLASSNVSLAPSPPSGDYIIYSGAYTTQVAADSALTQLKHAFPTAIVVKVSGATAQVSGYQVSTRALAQGRQIAQQDSRSTGRAASGAGLPDVVVVP